MEHLYVWRWREAIIQFQVPNTSSVDSEAESLTNKWLWHLLATVLPAASWHDSRITSRSYNHLCVTFVLWTWAATRHPRRQHWRWPCWHTRTIHMETCVCIIELLTTERININVCQIPTELTVNIVTVTQDRNLAVMKLKREMLLWMKNKYVTCYDNDNHGLKVIVEHQSKFMVITTSEPEPDKRYPNSKF